jgi:hypothetical protein
MATMDADQVAVKIPADYLEDVRSALVDEIEEDSAALTVDQAAVVGSPDVLHREPRQSDRNCAARILGRDMQLLSLLLDATGDTTVTAGRDTIVDALQATVRVLNRRLARACGYGPLPMGEVVELSTRLRWAADEAIRLFPELNHRLADEKAVA